MSSQCCRVCFCPDMGVRQLWSVLQPVKTSVGGDQIAGLSLAVDLSGWLFQSERAAGLKELHGPKPLLRNLFYRVAWFIKHKVKAVFVLDGDSPEVKQQTLQQRRKQRDKFYGRDAESSSSASTVPPQHHHRRVSQTEELCCQLFECLGVPHLRSVGEAEAMCARLDAQGLVDGCVTDDSDAFLFGASTVYKNFSVASAKNSTIERYRLSDVKGTLGLDRESLVCLALLVGGDYDVTGVPGVGKEQAVRLLKQWGRGQEALDRLRQWTQPGSLLDEIESREPVKKARHCSHCSHEGSANRHVTDGCLVCNIKSGCSPTADAVPCPCEGHRQQREHDRHDLELRVRKKALAHDRAFPNQKVVEAYLRPACHVTEEQRDQLRWRRPDFLRMCQFCADQLGWRGEKLVDHVLPLLTAWDMVTGCVVDGGGGSDSVGGGAGGGASGGGDEPHGGHNVTKAHSILQEKCCGLVYIVKWENIGGVERSLLGLDPADDLVTEESTHVVRTHLPQTVRCYEERKAREGREKAAKGRAKRALTSPGQQKMNDFFKVKKFSSRDRP